MQQYGVFAALAVGAVLWIWLALAYGRAFWLSRRISHLQQTVLALVYLTFVLVLPFGFGPDPMPAPLIGYYCAFMLIPATLLWRRWHGVVVEPGYASARELLRLRRPLADPPVRNAAAGLFVPLNVIPDASPRFSWRGLLGGIAILATIPVVLWLIALLEAAFSN